ncbi:MAG: hypothetical protein AAFP76_06370 [Bacteroidota bacterium]
MPLYSPHNLPEKYRLTHVIKSSIARVYVYNKNIAVVEINEGVNLSYLTGMSLLVKGVAVFGNRPWVYISNRINSYSVVPTDYKYLHRIGTLKALSIVTHEEGGKLRPHVESIFCKKPFDIFDELEEAMEWAEIALSKGLVKK